MSSVREKARGKRRVPCRATLVPMVLLALPAALVPAPALKADMDVERRERCERGGIARVVELRETPGSGLPCEVAYLKPDEGGSESVLWMARADPEFCGARFESFLVKLESKYDWSCERVDGGTVAAASDEAPSEPSGADSAMSTAALPEELFEEPTKEPVEEPARALSDAATLAARPVSDTSEPALAGAVSGSFESSGALTTIDTGEEETSRIERLRTLVPSGTYTAVPMPSGEREGDIRVSPFCPPGGDFAWRDDDPALPVFAMGETIAFAVRVPDTALDASTRFGIVSSVGEGATRELQMLSPAPSAGDARAIDIRVIPRGPGSGALSPSNCRYVIAD